LAEWDFEVDATKGVIFSPYSFPEGYRNVYVDYDAGWTAIPEDLQLAALILIKNIYQRRSEESFGTTNYSISGMSMAFEREIPMQAKSILNQYRRILL
jgi:AAA15 family ATPase/GTPase